VIALGNESGVFKCETVLFNIFLSNERYAISNIVRRIMSSISYILISMIGANRGMACIVDDQRTFSIKNVGLVKRNDSINQRFLLYFLKSNIATEYVKSNSKGGAQEFLGLTELRKFPILITSLSLQETIVTKLDLLSAETQRLEFIYQQKLASLDALKKSLLDQAFTGHL
jgi:type I restriction enzyme, S subunit